MSASSPPQTTNEIVRGLENALLVERVEAADGRREIALRLTVERRRRLAAGEKRVVEVETAALASLSERERRAFVGQLDRCTATLEAAQGDGPAPRKAAPYGRAIRKRG